jgi:Zn-finger nucleic acid-binding protein
MARCPRCSGEMETTTIAGVELDVCSSCRGVWFDTGELERVLQLQTPALARIPFYADMRSREDAAWDPPPAFCPGCSAALSSRRFKEAIPVVTQVCPNKHGLWLDRGELRRIKQFQDSLAASALEDDVEAERISDTAEGDDKRAPKSIPISREMRFALKGKLVLAASILLTVVVFVLLISGTSDTFEPRVISKEFSAVSTGADGNEIVRHFSTDTVKVASTQGTRVQDDKQTRNNSTADKSEDRVKQADLTPQEKRDKALAKGIDAYLKRVRSPMAGTGETFVAASNDTGVDPILSVAIAGKESSFGRYCFVPYNAFGMKAPQYLKGFSSWEKAIWANSRYLLRRYGRVSSPYQCQGYCVPDHPWMEDVTSIMNAIHESM